MRPLRLDLEGFGTFRSPTTLDLSDTDFFALVGPTGSGKTTILDALCFALYGTAPRWGKGQVSLGLARSVSHCRVGLVFDLAGRRFAAIRVLSRAARGQVTTKEARLVELPGDRDLTGEPAEVLADELRTLAATGPDVTAALTGLTGLSWDHFVQCVVLPQGEFAKFLQAEPNKRQDLLVSLLGLKLYEQVMNRANLLAREHGARAATLAGELSRYADATEEAVAAAEQRAAALRDLPSLVAERVATLAAAEEAARRLEAEAGAATARVAALAAIRVPPGLGELADRRAALVAAQRRADDAVESALVAQEAADEAAGEAGDPRDLAALVEAHDRLAALRAGRPAVEQEQGLAAAAVEAAGTASAQARNRRAQAEAARETVRVAHAADDLARSLVAGADCPVCRQPVAALPDRPAHATLDEAEAGVRAARDAEDRAGLAAQRAEQAAYEAGMRLAQLDAQERQAAEAVAERPGRDAAEAARLAAAEARGAVEAAATEVRRARAAQQTARAAAAASDQEWQALAADFQAARDPFAGEGAPPATGDPARDWAALVTWAEQRAAELAERQTATESARRAAAAERDAARAGVRAAFTDRGLEPPADALQAEVAAHRAADRVESDAERLRARRDTAAGIRADIDAARTDEGLHHDLAQLLGARYFERWLVAEALDVLVAEASTVLHALSGGQFELSLDAQQIEVVDHNDASLRRPVSTLSGGETFQASLAMALAMSAQIASLSAVSDRRLDTILLDEGFGTLDPASLEVVATTLERLAQDGDRVVGVVTHVAELAARVPVRFEVTRTGSSSSVAKVHGDVL